MTIAERGCPGIILNGIDRRHEAPARNPLPWVYHDGGRCDAGFRGETGDCVTRAIAIATKLPYREVYDTLNDLSMINEALLETGRRSLLREGQRSRSRTGVARPIYDAYLKAAGWEWTPTMGIGTGCTVHLRVGELPAGRLIVRLSKHVTAVIDGVVFDIHDPGRGGDRCVYGYYQKG